MILQYTTFILSITYFISLFSLFEKNIVKNIKIALDSPATLGL